MPFSGILCLLIAQILTAQILTAQILCYQYARCGDRIPGCPQAMADPAIVMKNHKFDSATRAIDG
jgi:hypothetical protein